MKSIVEILQEMRPNFDFAHSEDFIADGYLDSFDLTKLIVQLEAEYGIQITGEDVRAENFRNAAALRALLQKHVVAEHE